MGGLRILSQSPSFASRLHWLPYVVVSVFEETVSRSCQASGYLYSRIYLTSLAPHILSQRSQNSSLLDRPLCSPVEVSLLSKLLQLIITLMGSRDLAGGSLKEIDRRATHSHFYPVPINSGFHKLLEKQQCILVSDLEHTQYNTFWVIFLHPSKILLTELFSHN